MKRTILLSLFALLLLPALAIAESSAAVPAPAAAVGSPGCDSGLSFLAAAPVTPAGGALPALSPLANAEQKSASCCTARRITCTAGCACGVFEFSCDATATPCQASCICNIC
jgi:hypothetical protein